MEKLKLSAQYVANIMLVVITVLVMGGCSSINYQFGDLSKVYCSTDKQELRAQIRAKLTAKGVNVGIDYCAVRGHVKRVRGS